MFEALLEDLQQVTVDDIPLIDTLKCTPRSGKALRFDQFGLRLPKRSVYDHIISLPPQAQFFLSASKVSLNVDLLISLLLFHDLSEALIGDAPSFTSPHLAKETYRSEEEKGRAENGANQRLLAALPHPLKAPFESFLTLSKNSPLYQFFHMVDKTDPIIAIWRYIHLYRGKIDDIDLFLTAMEDFFLNPEVQHCCIDEKASIVVKLLQTRDYAREYYAGSFDFAKHLNLQMSQELKSLIEERAMHCLT